MYGQSDEVEHRPDRAMKQRLDDFLYELRAISARYEIFFDGDVSGATNALVDARTDKILGYGLTYVLSEGKVPPTMLGYDCESSIHDGEWLVHDDKGDLVEQMETDGRQERFRRKNLGR